MENATKFDPNADDEPLKEENEGELNGAKPELKEDDASQSAHEDQLQLDFLDVTTILSNGKPLLGSAPREYEYKLAAMDPADRLAHQKKTLMGRLGLAGEYVDEDLNDDADTKTNPETPWSPTDLQRIDTSLKRRQSSGEGLVEPGSAGVSAETPTDGSQTLSKRQVNMLKRKNKKEVKTQANKFQILDIGARRTSMNDTPAHRSAAIKKESTDQDESSDYFSIDRTNGDDESKVVSEFKGQVLPPKSELLPESEEESVEWPFERLCEYLMIDLFDYSWEIRHGATLGLRELIRVHGKGAGREKSLSRAENDRRNRQWLNDLACRVCCVFMLDRFGDYISDNVVAPIRETAGQALGSLLQYLPAPSVKAIYNILQQLVLQDTADRRIWQACHGGMIGMRYLVAVRQDVLLSDEALMDGVLTIVMRGLADADDDVRAVSAATLIPVADELVKLRPSSLHSLVAIVWDCLEDLSDDLSASTGSVMDLLAKLCGFPEVLDVMKQDAINDSERSFTQLVPRLYPFLRHTITTVRSAGLRALLTFLDIRGENTRDWIDGKILRLAFQNIFVERDEGVLNLSLKVWVALVDALSENDPNQLVTNCSEPLSSIMAIALHPIGVLRSPMPINSTYFIRPSGSTLTFSGYATSSSPTHASSKPGPKPRPRSRSSKLDKEPAFPTSPHNIDGPMIQGDVDLVGTEVMIRSRLFCARALGKLMSAWPSDGKIDAFSAPICRGLESSHSSTRLTAAAAVEEHAKQRTADDPLGPVFTTSLYRVVDKDLPASYSDLVSYLRIVQAQCFALNHSFSTHGHIKSGDLAFIAPMVQGEPDAGSHAFSIMNAKQLVDDKFESLKKKLSPAQRIVALQTLDDTRADAQRAIEELTEIKEQRDVRIKAAAAAALVALNDVPKKPGGLIKSLMDSIKSEENVEIQRRSAAGMVGLIRHLVSESRNNVVEKVVGNLTKFYCMDTAETPEFPPNASVEAGILSLRKDEDIRDHADQAQYERDTKAVRLKRRGAREALELLCSGYGSAVFERVPTLKKLIERPLHDTFSSDDADALQNCSDESGQQAVDGMSTMRALVGHLHSDLHPFVLSLVPHIATALKSKLCVFRYAAAKCLATICSVISVEGFSMLVKQVLPSISNAHDMFQRQGTIECIYHLIQVMGDSILPYVVFLIVPVLGRMSDSDNDIRLIATTAFATLVKLVPLEAGIPDPPGLSEELLEGRERERKFMSQMLDPKKIEPFEIPVAIKAELRSYQQDGVNWLAFLNRYHLHGVLCDDMGLGKTLQTLCVVASDHHLRAEEFAKTQNPDSRRLPSLIVCPPTLSGHWQQEIRAYAPFLTPVTYVGPPNERGRFRAQLGTADIVITSYEICRNDIEILGAYNWNYCVLDEGHLIKNPVAKTTLAVKRLISNHRLILSGTPIQNNVLELWSLFDFLMPGFLGTEKVFKDRFAKPIAASRFSKSSSKEQEAGALAVEALHKQVLPFLLRRLKEEVLNDLPPKILQNYYCDLSDLQKKLFEDFSKKEGESLASAANSGDKESKQHIFTALQYMRKLCNSPALVMKEGHKQYAATQAHLAQHKTHLKDPVHAPKLSALRDLLVDCGIGASDVTSANAAGTSTGKATTAAAEEAKQLTTATEAVSQHRALIFCQMKEMLDIVQNSVFKQMLPSVSFLRLDGGVEASRRQEIVNTFNGDPSIDCLLLTTSVGGLGLNLTGADTVIFVEHDWNPQKDIQAMDRAHRIGQKKVVNVHRLVTRGTLEEKILNLQRFKIDVASQVVSQQNAAGLAGMETGEILDLFNLEGAEAGGPGDAVAKAGAGNEEAAVDEVTGEVKEKGKKGFLDDLGELWDESQYEEEYNLDDFMARMKG